MLFNVNYAQRSSCRNIVGGFVKYCKNLRYLEHEYYPNKEDQEKFIREHPGEMTQVYWPGYSLRPSLLKIDALKKIGNFEDETGHFEMDYAKRYYKNGYKSGFLDTICSYHIGKLTWENNQKVPNAYNLNQVNQFVTNSIKIIEEDEWLVVDGYDSFGNDIKYLNTQEVEILKTAALADEDCIGFNNLGYLKSVIVPKELWIDVSKQYTDFKMYICKERYYK